MMKDVSRDKKFTPFVSSNLTADGLGLDVSTSSAGVAAFSLSSDSVVDGISFFVLD